MQKYQAWCSVNVNHFFFFSKVAITPITSLDVYNLKPEREYLFRVTPRNKYGWGESVVSTHSILTSQRTGLPQFTVSLYPQIKALLHSDVVLSCEVYELSRR